MGVQVRMFAALREAAGESETTVAAGTLDAVLAELAGRYGPTFQRRLPAASILVDGTAVARNPAIEVPDGAEVVLLPPVSGGAHPD